MPTALIILILGTVGLIAYIIAIYNTLQTLKTQITASIQEIGNQLKRQASLIPNLQASVKGMMKQETGIFEMLTKARTQVAHAQESQSPADLEKAISQVQSLMPQMSIAIEDNPEIKSDATVTKLMNELGDTSDKLMYARRSLIDLAQQYNQKIVIFPSNILANLFGFTPEKGLETAATGEHVTVSKEEMKDVTIDL